MKISKSLTGYDAKGHFSMVDKWNDVNSMYLLCGFVPVFVLFHTIVLHVGCKLWTALLSAEILDVFLFGRLSQREG